MRSSQTTGLQQPVATHPSLEQLGAARSSSPRVCTRVLHDPSHSQGFPTYNTWSRIRRCLIRQLVDRAFHCECSHVQGIIGRDLHMTMSTTPAKFFSPFLHLLNTEDWIEGDVLHHFWDDREGAILCRTQSYSGDVWRHVIVEIGDYLSGSTVGLVVCAI